jgi:Protein of unknown function (DUF1194)
MRTPFLPALLGTALLGIAVLASPPAVAADGPAVDVALVLVSDVSRSIDDSEYQLQKQGYAAALSSPALLAAIQGGSAQAIALAYVEFASAGEASTVLDWTVVRSPADAQDFADRVAAAPRRYSGRTAIGSGIAQAMQALAAAPVRAARQVIDVCGDGTNNAGRDVSAVRDEAVAAGITVNGLTIINDHPASYIFAHVQPPGGLTAYYREHVAGGVGSFVLEVHDFASFGQAMTRKLIDEIASRRVGDAPVHG